MSTSIMKVKAKDLLVPTEYQRDVEVNHVARLAREWDNTSVGVLIGSKRKNGKIYVVDGLQRKSAKMEQGDVDYVFTVLVHDDLTIVAEAKLFVDTNTGRKNVAAFYKYRAGVQAEDPVDCAIDDVVTDLNNVNGLNLRIGATSSENVIGCVATMQRIVGKKGKNIIAQAEILEDTVRVMHKVYAKTEDPWSSFIMEGLAIFLMEHETNPKYSESSLIKVLRSMSPTQLITAARSRVVKSNRPAGEIAKIIFEEYEKGKTVNRLKAVV
jgi:hypothetical protein